MLIAAVIRNFCDAKHIVMPSRALDLWGNVSLSIFLAIALMSVALWQLASVAVAMIAMLAAQTILMYFYARFVVDVVGYMLDELAQAVVIDYHQREGEISLA